MGDNTYNEKIPITVFKSVQNRTRQWNKIELLK